jgi:hypothetical protein
MEFYLQAPRIVGGDKKKARANADRIFAINPSRGNLAYARVILKENPQADVANYYVNAALADPHSYGGRVQLANFYASDRQRKYDPRRVGSAARVSSGMPSLIMAKPTASVPS